MTKKKTKAKTKTKTKAASSKKPKIAAVKKAKAPIKAVAKKEAVKVTSKKIENEKKKPSALLGDVFGDDDDEIPVTATAAVPFHADDFDTTRKEFEEGYTKKDDADTDDDETAEDDIYADDETAAFESYDDEFSDFEDEDDYGPKAFADPAAKKKKYEDEEE